MEPLIVRFGRRYYDWIFMWAVFVVAVGTVLGLVGHSLLLGVRVATLCLIPPVILALTALAKGRRPFLRLDDEGITMLTGWSSRTFVQWNDVWMIKIVRVGGGGILHLPSRPVLRIVVNPSAYRRRRLPIWAPRTATVIPLGQSDESFLDVAEQMLPFPFERLIEEIQRRHPVSVEDET